MAAVLACALAFCSMEGVAYLAHRYLMHGPLWALHRDHHQGSPRRLQRNDAFFVIFAAPAVAGFVLGSLGHPIFCWIATGITLYGATYVAVHELFIHERLRLAPHAQWRWLRAVRSAHHRHHRHLEREHGESFGLLWVTSSATRRDSAASRGDGSRSTGTAP